MRPDRIAVLAFENRTGDPTLDPVGQMTADGIINGLAGTGLVDIASVTESEAPSAAPEDDTATDRAAQAKPSPNTGGVQAALVVSGAYYLDDDHLLFQAHVTHVPSGRILSVIDRASSPVDAPGGAIEVLRQRTAGLMAVLFDPRADAGPTSSTVPSPMFAAYTQLVKGLDLFYSGESEAALERLREASRADTTFLQPSIIRGAVSVILQRHAEAASVRDELRQKSDRLSRLELVQVEGLDALLRGDWESVQEAWHSGPDLAPRFNTFVRAWAAHRAGNHARALELLDDVDPSRGGLPEEFEPLWEIRTAALHATGQHARELKEAQSAARRLPGSPPVLFMQARALAALDRPEDALELLRATPEAQGTGTPRHVGSSTPDVGAARLLTALELRSHGHREAASTALDLAASWYDERGDENATWSDTLILARIHHLSGHFARARSLLVSAPPEALNETDYHELMGTVAAQTGDTAGIRRSLTALERPTEDVMGRRTFARAIITCLGGRQAEASELLEEAERRGFDVARATHLRPELVAAPLEAGASRASGDDERPRPWTCASAARVSSPDPPRNTHRLRVARPRPRFDG